MEPGGNSLRPPAATRQQSAIRKRYSNAVRVCAEATANFFGLSPTTQSTESQKWEMRRAELLRRRFGNARQPTEASVQPYGGSDEVDGISGDRPASLPVSRAYTVSSALPPTSLPLVMIQGATPRRRDRTPGSMSYGSAVFQRTSSLDLRGKESVSSLALNTIKQAVRRRPSSKCWAVVQDAELLPSPMDIPQGSLVETPLSPTTPGSIFSAGPQEEGFISEFTPIPEEQADVPDTAAASADFHLEAATAAPLSRMVFKVHAAPPPPPQPRQVSFGAGDVVAPELPVVPDLTNDAFYDMPRNYFVTRGMLDHCQPTMSAAIARFSHHHLSTITEVASSTSSLPGSDDTDLAASVVLTQSAQCLPAVFDDPDLIPKLASLEGGDATDGFISAVMERTERSTLPFRIIGRLLGRNDDIQADIRPSTQSRYSEDSKPSSKRKASTKSSTFDSSMLDNRAFFTYWITLVHVTIFLFSVISYGIAPIGIDTQTSQAMIMREWGVTQLMSRSEPENLWIGPSQASLVHLGARYAPCMRSDSNINNLIENERESEEDSGCCIRNDRTGCIQSTKTDCSDALSTWLKWPDSSLATRTHSGASTATNNYTHGPVCGLDPEYCLHPSSVAPFNWPTNITSWPICTKQVPQAEIPKEVLHMQCDVIGRPCCVGLVGQCILTTREYCEFQNGYFHQEAFLCSQVSCMGDVCGMIPFADDWKPDQFYRLWTSLFLHAGVLHLLVSVAFQMTIMRHLEKYAGWLRIAIIYLVSGLVGNLASAIFTPYHAEAGPTGSHFALIACLVVSLIVDIVHNKTQYTSPWLAVLKIVLICMALFAIGLLPFIDNWAHVFGFVFGAILSCVLLPDVELSRLTRASTVLVCFFLSAGILTALVLLFYFFPVYECEACAYFNCIPFTPTFCATRRIQLPNLVKA